MFDIDSPFTMVVMIVAITVGAGVLTNYLKMRQNEERIENDPEKDAMRREITDLRARVHNLEKILTDPEEKLKRDFERL